MPFPTPAFVHSPAAAGRPSTRKYAVGRHSKQGFPLATILLPVLCITLLVFPQFNFTALRTLLHDSQYATQQNLTTAPPQILTDNELSAAARRIRPLPPCALSGARAKTFLMVFMGHSGSTAMISELRQHTQTHIKAAELVDHQDVFNTTEALQITRNFFDEGIRLGLTPGFKVRPNHILKEPQKFRQLVEEYDTRILWQYRQNIFKASVGEYATRYLNDTRAVEGLKTNMTREEMCKQGAGCTFRIRSFDFLHQTLKQKTKSHHLITSAVNALTASSGCVREVPYEDYLYDRAAVMQDMQRFLGLRPERTEPARFKVTGDSMCEVVENWGEVCKNFYGCLAWQHMMDDARNRCFCKYTTGPVSYCDTHIEQ